MKQWALVFLLIFSISIAHAGDPVTEVAAAFQREDYAAAYNLILPLAERGDPEMQFTLALVLAGDIAIGMEAPRTDRDKLALRWLKRAASSGHVHASEWLADIFQHGWYGQAVNVSESACWREVATKKLAPHACSHLAN